MLYREREQAGLYTERGKPTSRALLYEAGQAFRHRSNEQEYLLLFLLLLLLLLVLDQ